MRYVVRVGDREVDVDIDGDTVRVEDLTAVTRLEDVAASAARVVTIGRDVHRLVAQRGAHRGQYTIQVAGYRLDVEALDERARAIRKLTSVSGGRTGPAHLVAPMPGLIVRVNVTEGDRVQAAQGVVVMEAMKMENELRAPANGVVKRVLVEAGMAVEKGAMLLEVKPDAS